MNIKKNWWILVLVTITFIGILGISYFILFKEEKIDETKKAEEQKVKINEIIDQVKEENKDYSLEYESRQIKEIKSLVYLVEDKYKNIIIDTKTGEYISFEDLIKDQDKFAEKEQELLNLKYPKFIADTIINENPVKTYYVKDNEVIIYYDRLEFPYEYKEQVSLKINYNEVKKLIKFTPVLDSQYENEDGYNYDPNKKSVALTFDDGPTKVYNHYFLEALANNKAHATFFMVGNMMKSCEECVKNTYMSGNEIGSHTYEHMNIKSNSIANYQNSLKKVEDIYTSVTNDTIKLVRPPYGSYNKTNLQNIDDPLILWNLDTEDWRYHDVNHIVEYIKNNVSDGSIILMHELYETSYQALDEILPWLYVNGYNVVSVSELAKLKNKSLEAGHAYYNFK